MYWMKFRGLMVIVTIVNALSLDYKNWSNRMLSLNPSTLFWHLCALRMKKVQCKRKWRGVNIFSSAFCFNWFIKTKCDYRSALLYNTVPMSSLTTPQGWQRMKNNFPSAIRTHWRILSLSNENNRAIVVWFLDNHKLNVLR